MYPRLSNPLLTNTFFLFGARSTGKTSLLYEKLQQKAHLWIDLLDDENFLKYSRRPKVLEELIASKGNLRPLWIVIDEVQRVPKILNEVHRLLEDPRFKNRVLFALTGSSARKLKRGASNLLGGRALLNYLFPLTSFELKEEFDLHAALTWGTLPQVYSVKDRILKDELLKSYIGTYLREEIREEQVLRSLDPFVRFLEVAAQSSGKIVNYSHIGRDCAVDSKTVARYFQILEETLLGVFLPAHHNSVRKQQRQNPKFYFFDLGVQRALQGMLSNPIIEQSYEYGKLFEEFIFLEIFRLNHYLRKDFKLSYLRTKDDAEIDLIIEKPDKSCFLIKIKSTNSVSEIDANKLARFAVDFKSSRLIILSRDATSRKIGQVSIFPWREGISEIFEIVS